MNDILKVIGNFAKKNAPQILTGIGIGGNIASTVVAVKNTPKAIAKIEARKEELGVDKLTIGETIKVTWKDYAPSLLLTATSSACLISSVSIGSRRTAAMAAAYELSEMAYKEYRDEIRNVLGEEKANEINCEVADRVNEKHFDTPIIMITPEERSDCYFDNYGFPFKASINEIKEVINKLNHRMISESYVSVSDILDEFNIPHSGMSDRVGWNIYKNGFIEIKPPEGNIVDGKPHICIQFMNEPVLGFDSSWG